MPHTHSFQKGPRGHHHQPLHLPPSPQASLGTPQSPARVLRGHRRPGHVQTLITPGLGAHMDTPTPPPSSLLGSLGPGLGWVTPTPRVTVLPERRGQPHACRSQAHLVCPGFRRPSPAHSRGPASPTSLTWSQLRLYMTIIHYETLKKKTFIYLFVGGGEDAVVL